MGLVVRGETITDVYMYCVLDYSGDAIYNNKGKLS